MVVWEACVSHCTVALLGDMGTCAKSGMMSLVHCCLIWPLNGWNLGLAGFLITMDPDIRLTFGLTVFTVDTLAVIYTPRVITSAPFCQHYSALGGDIFLIYSVCVRATSAPYFAPFGCRFAPNWIWSKPSHIQSPPLPFRCFRCRPFLPLTQFLHLQHAVHIGAHLYAMQGWSLVCSSILSSDASAAYVIRGLGMQGRVARAI
jgi:hypothetical protein